MNIFIRNVLISLFSFFHLFIKMTLKNNFISNMPCLFRDDFSIRCQQ